MPNAKQKVVISRQWNNPQITAFVDNEGIGAAMALDDFVEALGRELGSPAFLLTNAQLMARLHAAQKTVEAEIKLATIAVA